MWWGSRNPEVWDPERGGGGDEGSRRPSFLKLVPSPARALLSSPTPRTSVDIRSPGCQSNWPQAQVSQAGGVGSRGAPPPRASALAGIAVCRLGSSKTWEITPPGCYR